MVPSVKRYPWQHGQVIRFPSTQARCCLVVGMHNSGTSLLGGLLHAAGLPMGPRLLLRSGIEPERRPRYDYFEDAEVVALQEATLLDLDRHWSSYRSAFVLPDPDHPARQAFRRQLRSLLRMRLRRQKLWIVKDPRTAVLLEDWLTVLRDLAIRPAMVIVVRDPGSNIRSFSGKGRVPLLTSEALWQRTYANALRLQGALDAADVAVMRYDDLLANPVRQTQQLCSTFGWRVSAKRLARVGKTVDPTLPTQSHSALEDSDLHPVTHLLHAALLGSRHGPQHFESSALLAQCFEQQLQEYADQLQLAHYPSKSLSVAPKHRVAIVTAELHGFGASGGIGAAFWELACCLADAGHPISILLLSAGQAKPAALPHGMAVDQLDPTCLSRLELTRAVAAWLSDHPVDVVHLHDWLGLGSGLKTALAGACPWLVVGLHGVSSWTRTGNPWPRSADDGLLVAEESLYDEGVVRALERDAIHQADVLVAPSGYMAAWVRKEILCDQPDRAVFVQRNCSNSAASFLASSSGNARDRSLVFYGRLEQRKGLLLFLEALQWMRNRPERVLFVGTDCALAEGVMASQRIGDRLAPIGIPWHLEPGLDRDQALVLLRQLEAVVVMPSLIENSSCALEELLDSGLRVVATDVGGTRELLAPECWPWLSPAEPQGLAKHLDQALTCSNAEVYRLRSCLPPWLIRLSWQAFHEHLPRRLPMPVAPDRVAA